MRKALDALYAATGVMAASATALIAAIVLIQVGGRLLGFGIRGADDLVAWLTASASIAGIGYAFTQQSHVRVELLVERLHGRARRAAAVLATGLGLAISGYAAYACVLMVYESYAMGELSQGDFPVKLWIPQLGIAVGAVTLAVAVADALHRVLGEARRPAAAQLEQPLAEV